MTTPEDIQHVMEFRRRYELDAYTDQALNQLNRTISQVEREIVRQWGKVGLRTEFSQGRAIALLEELRHWPTYYPAALNGAQILAEMLAH